MSASKPDSNGPGLRTGGVVRLFEPHVAAGLALPLRRQTRAGYRRETPRARPSRRRSSSVSPPVLRRERTTWPRPTRTRPLANRTRLGVRRSIQPVALRHRSALKSSTRPHSRACAPALHAIRSAKVVWSTTSEMAWRTRPQKPKKWHSPWNSHSFGRDWLTQSTGAIGPSTYRMTSPIVSSSAGLRQAIAALGPSPALHKPAALELAQRSLPRTGSESAAARRSRRSSSAPDRACSAKRIDRPERIVTLRRHTHRLSSLAGSEIIPISTKQVKIRSRYRMADSIERLRTVQKPDASPGSGFSQRNLPREKPL